MTKYTEQEVREAADWHRRDGLPSAGMLTAYADLLAAQRGWETLGVGDGSGNLFVHGPHDAIKECQRRMLAAQPVAVPDWCELVPSKEFGELMYWLDRCDDKGHLDNCSDLIEPLAAFHAAWLAMPAAEGAKAARADFRASFPLAFVTTQSGGGDYKLVLSFGTMDEMHKAHRFILGIGEPAEGAKVAQPAEVLSEWQADIPDGAADTLIDAAKVSDFHPDGSQREKLRELVRRAAFEWQARAVLAQPSEGDGLDSKIIDMAFDSYREILLKTLSESDSYGRRFVQGLITRLDKSRAALAQQPGQGAGPVAYLHYAKKKPSERLLSFNPRPTIQQRARGWVSLPLCAAIAASTKGGE